MLDDRRRHRRSVLLPIALLVAGCEVIDIQPKSGFPGDPVTITASTDLRSPAVVEFGGGSRDKAPKLDPNRPRVLEATVPVGAKTGPIAVYGPDTKLKSDFEFTVLENVVREEWTNDDIDDPGVTANEIPWGTRIEGTIDEGGDKDWFYFKSGPEGPWAYTLEVQVVNKSQDRLTARLHIAGERLVTMNVAAQVPATSSTPAQPTKETMWVTALDDTDTFLLVRKAQGPTFAQPADYEINVAKVSVPDGREPNNSLGTSTDLPQTTGARVYLTPAYAPGPGTGVGAEDWYRIPAVRPGESLVVAMAASPSLGLGSTVLVRLFDKDEVEVRSHPAPADDPVVLFTHVVNGSQAGAADGSSPWYLGVSTVGGPDPWSGQLEPAPGRTRIPYGLAVYRTPNP